MANTVQLTKNGESIYPVTDISLVMGGIQAAPAGQLLPPPESDDFATKTSVDELEAKVTEDTAAINGSILRCWERRFWWLVSFPTSRNFCSNFRP